MRSLQGWLVILLLTLVAACGAGQSSSSPSPGRDRDLITREEIEQGNFRTAFDAVRSLRANWLVTKGQDSFQSPTQVQVYFDGTRLGGVDQLRTITFPGIAYIRYYDGLAASARWGMDHGQGVIFVSSREP